MFIFENFFSNCSIYFPDDEIQLDLMQSFTYFSSLPIKEGSHTGIILFKKYGFENSILSQENSIASYSSDCEDYELESIFSNYLVDKAINRKQPIYVSNKKGEPALGKDENSDFIAAIPSLSQNNVTSVLIIKNMSFMAFNIENLEESYDDIYWYVLDSYPSSCTFSGAKGLYSSSLVQSSNSIDRLSLKAPKLPYIDKVIYSPAPWLVYNRFNSSATEHSFKVEFTSNNKEWAGRGDLGLTVDKNISNGRYQKMDW